MHARSLKKLSQNVLMCALSLSLGVSALSVPASADLPSMADPFKAPEQNLSSFLTRSKVRAQVREILEAYKQGLLGLDQSLETVEKSLSTFGGKPSPLRLAQKASSLASLGFMTTALVLRGTNKQAKMNAYGVLSAAISSTLTLISKPEINKAEVIEVLNKSIINITEAIDADGVDTETRAKSLHLLEGLTTLKKGIESSGRPWQERLSITQMVLPLAAVLVDRFTTLDTPVHLLQSATNISTVGLATMDLASIVTEEDAKQLLPKIRDLRTVIAHSNITLAKAIEHYK